MTEEKEYHELMDEILQKIKGVRVLNLEPQSLHLGREEVMTLRRSTRFSGHDFFANVAEATRKEFMGMAFKESAELSLVEITVAIPKLS